MQQEPYFRNTLLSWSLTLACLCAKGNTCPSCFLNIFLLKYTMWTKLCLTETIVFVSTWIYKIYQLAPVTENGILQLMLNLTNYYFWKYWKITNCIHLIYILKPFKWLLLHLIHYTRINMYVPSSSMSLIMFSTYLLIHNAISILSGTYNLCPHVIIVILGCHK